MRPVLNLRRGDVWRAILVIGLAAYALAVTIALGMYG